MITAQSALTIIRNITLNTIHVIVEGKLELLPLNAIHKNIEYTMYHDQYTSNLFLIYFEFSFFQITYQILGT